MVTIIEKASGLNCEYVIEKAAHILANGGLVAFPTETVYGLGANAFNPDAARKIYEAKGRPSDNPLIIHISGMDMLEDVCGSVSQRARELAERFWPGPLTMILPKGGKIPYAATGGLDTVAVRFPSHKTARGLIDKCGFPLAAPSANSSGKPSPTRASHVAFDLSGKIDMIIDGGPCEIGLESTIVDMTGEEPVILRPGYVSGEEITGCAETAVVFDGEPEIPISPGTKYTHYSPRASVTVVLGEPDAVAGKIRELIAGAESAGKKAGALVTEETRHLYEEGHIISVGSAAEMESIARNLFKALRKADFYGLDALFSVGFEETGLGAAVMNRLVKAAGNKVIRV